ncbi:hypothetical protein A3D78_04300 [Candidatus Gottesmanbacteria bacterium RIFCSPHIGHO2_02_FULL_39_14]|uniref:EfeO-type cupredoxin-like domain-containing protein n=3 Tax=Candidatus Gottesmaniibacteriota TaxID=1752720 RepID=A0A1F5ZTK6_9BACT|nr:MAG: hypothetical protein A2153_00400 [Candidatus Gottesmanbacteria bacterium RBG_16_38_7b]OGG15816.1 MAG: hypothetical protein A3D78_04300 [Candidatus Gottesmanbacteria bacterium RIFCSPHIGHO2_02_FULL_39_14]OGG32361.1 MAG: hypothetical protein A3I51_01655 [Candidatus Gottesmanbacteria bacterium RIFCSPLOWO2_02_FULL_38_8]
MLSLDQIITLLIGLEGIIFTYWYFFEKKEGVQRVTGSSITIKVDAGYSPSTIVIKKNIPVTLKIVRTDKSDCLEEIVIPEWKIKKYLPINKEVSLNLEAKKTGEYPFHCGMNMFHGKIIVK